MATTTGVAERSRSSAALRGGRIARFAVALIGALTLLGGVLPAAAGTEPFHDTWSLELAHGVSGTQPRSTSPAPGGRDQSAPGRRAKPRPHRVAGIHRERAPRLLPGAVTVLAALNSVRAKFGLTPARATAMGVALARAAALANRDPELLPASASVPEEFGIWGAVNGSPQASPAAIWSIVNAWVYQDGWMGSATENIDCTSPGAPACNGHREAILSKPPVAGAELYASAAVVPSSLAGSPAVSIAVILAWRVA